MTTDHTPFDAPQVSPLIMTALFDERSFERLDAMRRQFFPAALNRVPAHATLFHHLPGETHAEVATALAELARRAAPLPFAMRRTLFLGRGVALAIEAPGLGAVRSALARPWRDRLTPQDRQPYRPHVTIQNKVASTEARATEAELAALLPIHGTIVGLALWHYRGGPWEEAGRAAFEAPA